MDFKTSFHFRPTGTHNKLLHNPIFFNPWILQNPSVKDFAEYGKKKSKTEYLKPESFGLSKNKDCRQKKVVNMLDEQGFKPIKRAKG